MFVEEQKIILTSDFQKNEFLFGIFMSNNTNSICYKELNFKVSTKLDLKCRRNYSFLGQALCQIGYSS